MTIISIRRSSRSGKSTRLGGFLPTLNPARYVRIAEDLYLVSFYAPRASGMEVSMLIDLKALRALGAAFGLDSTDKFCSYTFGAKGAFAQLGFLGLYTVN